MNSTLTVGVRFWYCVIGGRLDSYIRQQLVCHAQGWHSSNSQFFRHNIYCEAYWEQFANGHMDRWTCKQGVEEAIIMNAVIHMMTVYSYTDFEQFHTWGDWQQIFVSAMKMFTEKSLIYRRGESSKYYPVSPSEWCIKFVKEAKHHNQHSWDLMIAAIIYYTRTVYLLTKQIYRRTLNYVFVDDPSTQLSCWKQSITDFLQYKKNSSWLFSSTVSTSSFMAKLWKKQLECQLMGIQHNVFTGPKRRQLV